MNRSPELLSDGKGVVVLAPIQVDPCDHEFIRNLWGLSGYEPLVHYLRLPYFFSLLESSSMRMRRLDLYFDTLEGQYPEANLHSVGGMTRDLYQQLGVGRDAKAMFDSQEVARRYNYIHCWFEGQAENAEMWREYGDGGRGICIKSTTGRLWNALPQHPKDLAFHVGRCCYRDERESINEMFSAAPAFRKRRRFSWENEIRLLAEIPMEHQPRGVDGDLVDAAEHRIVPVDLATLVEAIIIGPKVTDEEVGKVIETSAGVLDPGIIRASTVGKRGA